MASSDLLEFLVSTMVPEPFVCHTVPITRTNITFGSVEPFAVERRRVRSRVPDVPCIEQIFGRKRFTSLEINGYHTNKRLSATFRPVQTPKYDA